MQENLLAVPGVVLLALGTLVFFISSETKVFVEVAPFSVILILLFVAGLLLLGVGIASLLADKLE